jgi:hypothetical protein
VQKVHSESVQLRAKFYFSSISYNIFMPLVKGGIPEVSQMLEFDRGRDGPVFGDRVLV